MPICHEMLDLRKRPVECCNDLSERAMWSKHSTTIWRANHFLGSSTFYPVYRYQDYYSYSPLSLILFKGGLRVNPHAAEKTSSSNFFFWPGSDTIDKDIVRIGGPPKPGFSIVDADTFARRLAEAMCEDIAAIEADHSNFTNIILCGGKDSLNLTLLPWRNPVMVASAPPNYDLVKTFMTDNKLSYDVIRLDDNDDSLLESEILVNCCRNNLEHCRWGPHLKKISQAYDGKIIFWKGQAADILTTPYWKTFAYKRSPWLKLLRRGLGNTISNRVFKYFFEENNIAQRRVFKGLWSVVAMWQGAHVSIVRELTNALVLSGYHGPAVQKIWSQVDLKRAVQNDIRPIVGRHLHGEEVVYPSTNPGPSPSKIREGLSDLQPFLKALRSAGIAVYE